MSNETKEAARFLTEQACHNIWIMGCDADDENFKDFKSAVMHLAKGEPALQERFTEYTDRVMHEDGDTTEYDAEKYGGETRDAQKAIANLKNIAENHDMPDEVKAALNRLVCFITDFHAATEHSMTTGEIEKAVYFLTEQACYLAQANGKETADYKICEKAVRFLAKDDPKLLKPFKDKTRTVKHNPSADYETEQYDGKDADIRATIAILAKLANAPGMATENGKLLISGAEMIAEFYGMEDALPETA